MKQKQRRKNKGRAAKSVLRLPDLEVAKSAVVNSLSCPDAQRGYRHAIDEFVDWYCSEPRLSFSKTVVVRYRMHLESRHLAPGTINLRLGAVRRLAYEAADCGLLSADLAAGIRRVKGLKKLGVRLGNWLTADQGAVLWQAPDKETLKGKRDRALLSTLLACGLRRHEVAEVTVDHLQLSRFTFMDFESDLREFLGRHGIAKLPHPVTPPWRNLELAYCELIRDRTWDYTNKKDPTRWVNRVQVRMRDRRMDGSLPAKDQSFPFFLAWAFLWNDESRLIFEAEFLTEREACK